MPVPLLGPNQPADIEGTHFKRGYRELAIGPVYEIRFQVDKATWDAMELIPRKATVKGVLWWIPEDGKEPAPPVPEEERGPYGWYFQMLFKKGFQYDWSLLEALNIESGEQTREALHCVFKTKSLTTVSPEEFERWAGGHDLENLVSMSRQIVAKMESKQ